MKRKLIKRDVVAREPDVRAHAARSRTRPRDALYLAPDQRVRIW
jgi:hypothetical protein